MMSWIIGALAISSVVMCSYLLPVVILEARTGVRPWWKNLALRASGALFVHGLGGVFLFASMWSPGYQVGSEGFALYGIAFAFGLWLFSKAMIVSVGGGFRILALCLVIWTIVWLKYWG